MKTFEVLSYWSALAYYRTPPIVHELIGSYPDISTLVGKREALRCNSFGALDLPVHVLVSHKNEAYPAQSIAPHVWSNVIEPGMICLTEWGFEVTSPLMTLLNLASRLSTYQTMMLVHEFVGTFAVYRPSDTVRDTLQRLAASDGIPVVDGWRPSFDAHGRLTDLWQRRPLIELSEFEPFLSRFRKVHGLERLRDAVSNVWGSASSPFEVQAAMLLGLPYRKGGWGLGPFELNKPIRLSPRARDIASKNMCYADLYIEGKKGHPPLVIECQGSSVHTNDTAASDDNRAMALQSMGYSVLRLRYEQIRDDAHLRNTAACVASLVGRKLPPKSERLERKALELQASVLIDWNSLSCGPRRRTS